MIRLVLIGLLSAAALGAVASRAQTVSAPPAAAMGAPGATAANALPDAPGRATLLRVCTGCHEPTIVAQQRRTEKDWHDLVELMAGTGAQGTDAEFDEITRYLAKSFPAGQ